MIADEQNKDFSTLDRKNIRYRNYNKYQKERTAPVPPAIPIVIGFVIMIFFTAAAAVACM